VAPQAPAVASPRSAGQVVLPERTSQAEPIGERPNVMVLMCDELRYPPVYEGAGGLAFRTQHLRTQQALRETGLEFHRHYVASTACVASRVSMFTGHYPSLHGVSSTDGVAKGAHDPDVFWLDPQSVPTMGDYFRAGGYRTFYKGKWHGSLADLTVPGTRSGIPSFDAQGRRDLALEQQYIQADRMDGYGFEGWVGPEPHGKNPLNSGSSPAPPAQGRDQGFAGQTVDLITDLDRAGCAEPFLLVSSFVNPHDIALWGFASRASGAFDFEIEDIVPAFQELFDAEQFAETLRDSLESKPSCQLDYRDTYNDWMQGVPPHDYWRLYYQLQKESDDEMHRVYEALKSSRYYENTIVAFTSDHGDLLGSHGYMHQKWHNAYDEALRVPMIFSNPTMFPEPVGLDDVTSHIDLLPTLLGLAGLDPQALLPTVAHGHTDAVPLVGRDLSGLVRGDVASVSDPVYFMTDDEISRGSNPQNLFGAFFSPVIQPNHVETVIAKIDGSVWKYSRYFDNPQFWSSPGTPGEAGVMDVLLHEETPLGPNPPAGVHQIRCTRTVKYEPAPDEFELYDVSSDPMELDNLAGTPSAAAIEAQLAATLASERAAKRLYPVSGPVPGQIGPSATRAVPLPTPTPTTCGAGPVPPPPPPPPPPTPVDPAPVIDVAPSAPPPASPVVVTPTFTR
jgi:choline-sulfatase